jgi:hypothetical protein
MLFMKSTHFMRIVAIKLSKYDHTKTATSIDTEDGEIDLSKMALLIFNFQNRFLQLKTSN